MFIYQNEDICATVQTATREVEDTKFGPGKFPIFYLCGGVKTGVTPLHLINSQDLKYSYIKSNERLDTKNLSNRKKLIECA